MHVSAEGTLLDRHYSVSSLLFPSPTPTPANTKLLIPCRRLGQRHALSPVRSVGLPDTRLICRRPLSPVTPESRVVAIARCFTTRVGFRYSGTLATPIGVTRPNRVHLRYGWRLCLPRLQPEDCSIRLLGQLHGERALTMVSTFQLTKSARFSLAHQRTQRNSHARTLCALSVSVFQFRPGLVWARG